MTPGTGRSLVPQVGAELVHLAIHVTALAEPVEDGPGGEAVALTPDSE